MVNEEHKEFVRHMVKKANEKDPEAKPEYGVFGPKQKEQGTKPDYGILGTKKDPETQEHKEKVDQEIIKKIEEITKKVKDKAAGISD